MDIIETLNGSVKAWKAGNVGEQLLQIVVVCPGAEPITVGFFSGCEHGFVKVNGFKPNGAACVLMTHYTHIQLLAYETDPGTNRRKLVKFQSFAS